MKIHHISIALLMGLATLTSCEDKLELTNPNQQTTGTFGFNPDDLEEGVIAAYNHIRMEGSYARVGYTIDVCRGDEAWNSSQVWYMPFDDLNTPITEEIAMWPWREWYYTINVCNFVLSRCGDDNSTLTEQMKRIKGQVLFLRALSYYNLAGYFQNPPLITDYTSYSTLDGLYAANNTYDEVLDQVEKDFAEAITLLPSRDHLRSRRRILCQGTHAKAQVRRGTGRAEGHHQQEVWLLQTHGQLRRQLPGGTGV